MLGYPCNQFGMQEPYATPEELMNGIRWVRPGGNFDPQLDYFFEKSEVNGENELPIYTYMKGACGPTFSQFSKSHRLFYEPMRVGDIAWNFEKFLIDREGRPYARYHPHLVDPEHKDMLADIRAVLNPPTMTQEREPKSRFSQFTDNVRNLFNKR